MNRQEITEIVIEKIKFQLGISKVESVNDNLLDLGMDSLDDVELIIELESGFNIEISDDDACGIEIVSDIIDLVVEKVCDE